MQTTQSAKMDARRCVESVAVFALDGGAMEAHVKAAEMPSPTVQAARSLYCAPGEGKGLRRMYLGELGTWSRHFLAA
eukprot:s129_g35.t1